MSRRSGLGRGLAALIPPAPTTQEDVDDSGDRPTRADRYPEAEADDEGVRIIARSPNPLTTEDQSQGGVDDDHDVVVRTEPAAADAIGGDATGSDTPAASPASISTPDLPAPDLPQTPLPPADPSAGVTAATATLVDVAPDRIDPNPSQPRDVFDPDELEGLATSLQDIGVLQPLVVRPAAGGRYELIAGERRWRAAQLAGLATVPVVVRHTDDADLLKEALVENIHRVQLNPLEEAAAYQQLLEEFGVTQEDLALRLGRSRPSISNAIRLLQLPSAVQRRIAAGVLSAGHAKVLLAMDDAGAQTKLAERIIAEGLSVRATEELVRLQLIDGPARAPKARRTPTAPGLIELQEDLSDALEARVRITMGARKGKLAIEFASVDDLERIVGVIAGGISGSVASPELPATDD